ncbi:MAG: AbrB/MazE/SpoVT family DNA-binding domain-containing protein [Roseateles sp.]|nr:MAG: AbrB/MazE/SpoVT family DNA-binding domain-containing protein [Roseateles sp.]
MPARVFLDTEFIQTDRGPIFISAAFLTEDGRELYAERPREAVEALLHEHPHDFVREQVLPQLGRQPATAWSKLPARLVAWLDTLGADEVEVIYDYGNDYLLVEQLLEANPEPPRTRLLATNVSYLLDDPDGRRAAESAWEALGAVKGIHRHHALADAYSLRLRFDTVHSQVNREEPKTIEVLATVAVLVPEFELARAETDDGQLTLSIGKRTLGVAWQRLQVGQRLRCIVQVGGWTRVLRAEVLPMIASTATVGLRGRITLPAQLLQGLRLKPGDNLQFNLHDDGVVIVVRASRASNLNTSRPRKQRMRRRA